MRLLVTGGGTGGHIYPALAIISAVRSRHPAADVLYVGSPNGLEADIVPRQEIRFEAVPVRGLVNKSVSDTIAGSLSLISGAVRAGAIVNEFQPQVVVGTGGFVSGPVGFWAVLRRIPLILQEQNVYPGVTNRLLARFAKAVCVPFEAAASYLPENTRVQVTGNPVRPAIVEAERGQARLHYQLKPGERLLVITSGSRGADAVNRAVTASLDKLRQIPNLRVLWATGQRYFEAVSREIKSRGAGALESNHISIQPYIHQMDLALAAADLFLGRAGGMTVAEVTSRGLPSILVPSPNVTHDHQRFNAEALAESGAAWIIPEDELTGPRLLDRLEKLLTDADRLADMARASQVLGRPGAAPAIVQLIEQAVRL